MKKILYIDDEPEQLFVIRARLEANGFSVMTASKGKIGLAKAKEDPPDLIILDLLMPEMSGFELCKKLKSSSKTRHIPVIFITASGIRDLEEQAQKVGAEISLRRPYESSELLGIVQSLLEEQDEAHE